MWREDRHILRNDILLLGAFHLCRVTLNMAAVCVFEN